jgi:hypothetical protein
MKRFILIFLLTSITLLIGQIVDPHHPMDHAAVHPQMNDYCRTCHACDNPTPINPCLIQCPRHGAEFTGTHFYEEGPDIVIIDKISNLYKPVIFSHELHASMSDISGGCTLCHHYSEETGEIPSCGECHEEKSDITKLNVPSLKGAYHRQCLGCHREWSHENACQFCHEEITGPVELTETTDPTDIVGALHPLIEAEETYIYDTEYSNGNIVTFHHTDHVDAFGLNCTDCHKGDSCCRCHDVDKPQPTEEECINHLETCCTCHKESNCSFCHSNSVKPKFNHDTSTDFVLGHYHRDVDCNKCHNSVNDFITPSTECINCHVNWEAGVFDHAITGLTLSESHIEEDCESCHVDSDFTINPTCDNCHDDDITYPDYSPEE